jgi:hypothetical protein
LSKDKYISLLYGKNLLGSGSIFMCLIIYLSLYFKILFQNHKLLNKVEQPNLYSAWGAPSSKSSKSLSTCDEAVQCNEISLLESCSHQHRSTQTLDNITEAGYGEGKIIIPSDRAWTSKSLDSLHLKFPGGEGSGLDDVQLKSQYTQRTHSSAEERVREDQETVVCIEYYIITY